MARVIEKIFRAFELPGDGVEAGVRLHLPNWSADLSNSSLATVLGNPWLVLPVTVSIRTTPVVLEGGVRGMETAMSITKTWSWASHSLPRPATSARIVAFYCASVVLLWLMLGLL
jgi:hypothetical protein